MLIKPDSLFLCRSWSSKSGGLRNNAWLRSAPFHVPALFGERRKCFNCFSFLRPFISLSLLRSFVVISIWRHCVPTPSPIHHFLVGARGEALFLRLICLFSCVARPLIVSISSSSSRVFIVQLTIQPWPMVGSLFECGLGGGEKKTSSNASSHVEG
jgi:hypothetical protein